MARIETAEVIEVAVSGKTTWQHVLLRTEDGRTGVGEATLGAAGPVHAEHLRDHAAGLVGRAIGPDTLLPLAALTGGDRAERTCYAAFDQAVADLCAQASGERLARVLNPAASPGPIALYANINRATLDRSPAGFGAHAAQAAGEGYGAIKLAPFDGLTPGICGTPEGRALIDAGMARIAAVADAAPGCEVMVDCHWRFTKDAATDLCPALGRIGVVWFECPVPEAPDTICDLVDIRRAANGNGMRLTGLETHGDWSHVRDFVHGGAYDLIMPDVKHVGRLSAIVDLARHASEHGVAVSLHNPSGPVAHLASLHVMAATMSGERMEIQWNESPLFLTLTDPPPAIAGGDAVLPEGPGLGAKFTPPPA